MHFVQFLYTPLQPSSSFAKVIRGRQHRLHLQTSQSTAAYPMPHNHGDDMNDDMNDNIATTDFDSQWKTILTVFFWPFLDFFFPQVLSQIDTGTPPEFLDTELPALTRRSQIGRRHADKIVRVKSRTGKTRIVFIHVEVQGQRDPDFTERMYIYNSRIFERFHQPAVSLAVLIDTSPNWRPNSFVRALWGCRMAFSFEIAKLLDFKDIANLPEHKANPFSIVTLATLGSHKKQGNIGTRLTLRLALARRLYEENWPPAQARALMRFLEWILELPLRNERAICHTIHQWELSMGKPFMTWYEKEAINKGRTEGRTEGKLEERRAILGKLLRKKFKNQSTSTDPLVLDLTSLPEALYDEFMDRVLDFSTPAEVQAWLDEHKEQIAAVQSTPASSNH